MEKTYQIRKAESRDAEALVEYINIVAGESDFLTFGPGEWDKTVESEKKNNQ